VRPFVAVLLPLLFATSIMTPALAANQTRPHLSAMTFRLHVHGRIDPDATFWLAHGPIDGRFGIERLHFRGHGIFVLSHGFPLGVRAVFTFVMGHGVIKTRAGFEPGNPVVTISSIGPVYLNGETLPTVNWQAPIG
jgi:hypothetical protein